MKLFLKDLINIADEKTYSIEIKEKRIEDNVYLRGLKNVEGDLTFYYDVSDKLRVNYTLTGEMVCPCAISLEDTYVPFDISEDEPVTYDLDEEGFYLEGDIEIEDLAVKIVLPEVPIKVVKKEKIEYSKGDGWSFVSEDDFNSNKKEQIDPRLQKLKEYKFEEED